MIAPSLVMHCLSLSADAVESWFLMILMIWWWWVYHTLPCICPIIIITIILMLMGIIIIIIMGIITIIIIMGIITITIMGFSVMAPPLIPLFPSEEEYLFLFLFPSEEEYLFLLELPWRLSLPTPPILSSAFWQEQLLLARFYYDLFNTYIHYLMLLFFSIFLTQKCHSSCIKFAVVRVLSIITCVELVYITV